MDIIDVKLKLIVSHISTMFQMDVDGHIIFLLYINQKFMGKFEKCPRNLLKLEKYQLIFQN